MSNWSTIPFVFGHRAVWMARPHTPCDMGSVSPNQSWWHRHDTFGQAQFESSPSPSFHKEENRIVAQSLAWGRAEANRNSQAQMTSRGLGGFLYAVERCRGRPSPFFRENSCWLDLISLRLLARLRCNCAGQLWLINLEPWRFLWFYWSFLAMSWVMTTQIRGVYRIKLDQLDRLYSTGNRSNEVRNDNQSWKAMEDYNQQ